MANFDRTTRTMLLWIPDNIDKTSVTARIADEMNNKTIGEIDKTKYNGDFAAFYTEHIWNFETTDNTFCSKNFLGVSAEYSTYKATNAKFVTVLSVDIDDFSGDIVKVNAFITFRWSKTANAVKIQTLCADQRVKGTGEGTKLLNFVKKTAAKLGLYNMFLNPLKNAVPYYYRQHFKETNAPNKKIYDTSSPLLSSSHHSPKHSKSQKHSSQKHSSQKHSSQKHSSQKHSSQKHSSQKHSSQKHSSQKHSSPKHSKSAKHSSPHIVAAPVTKKDPMVIPTMIMNLRARSNWDKTKRKLRALSAIKHKKHGKSTVPVEVPRVEQRKKKTREELLSSEVDKIVGRMNSDMKDMVTYTDIVEKLENERFVNLSYEDVNFIRDHLYDAHGIN
jgi:N-acetylglutamate synthase-like GNAT family acetyltransferase